MLRLLPPARPLAPTFRRPTAFATLALLPALAHAQPSAGASRAGAPLAGDSAVLAAIRTRVVAYGLGAGGAPLDAHSVFEIGSVTKTFTAAPPARTAITLPATALDRFVGEYPLAPTFVIAVRRVGDRLTTQATGQPAFELFPESRTKFFLRVVDAQIEFQTDASGAVTGLVLVQNGVRQPAPRRAGVPAAPAPAGAP